MKIQFSHSIHRIQKLKFTEKILHLVRFLFMKNSRFDFFENNKTVFSVVLFIQAGTIIVKYYKQIGNNMNNNKICIVLF